MPSQLPFLFVNNKESYFPMPIPQLCFNMQEPFFLALFVHPFYNS